MINILANRVNPAKLIAQTQTQTSIFRELEKGVTKFFFNPPMKFSALDMPGFAVHKAEIVVPRDSQYVSFNFYNLANEFYSCTVSKDGRVVSKEFPDAVDQKKFKQMMNSIIYVINQQSQNLMNDKEKQIIKEIRPVIDNESALIVNTTGKEKTIRSVYMPDIPQRPELKQVRYSIISPEGNIKIGLISIHKEGARFEATIGRETYSAEMDNKGNFKTRLSREVSNSDGPDGHLQLTAEDKALLKPMFDSMLKEEHNKEYRDILNKVWNNRLE